jgi:hypothetical protein
MKRYPAYVILQSILDNGLPLPDATTVNIDVYENLSVFINDIRSLDFSPIDIAASVLLHSCDNINSNYTKGLRYMLTNVYGIELTMIKNALIVLKR